MLKIAVVAMFVAILSTLAVAASALPVPVEAATDISTAAV